MAMNVNETPTHNGNARQPPWREVVPLREPITHGDDILYELELHEPDLDGMMQMDKVEGQFSIALHTIMICTGLPPSVVKQIKYRDVVDLLTASEKILGEPFRATGGKRRPGSPTSTTGRPQS